MCSKACRRGSKFHTNFETGKCLPPCSISEALFCASSRYLLFFLDGNCWIRASEPRVPSTWLWNERNFMKHSPSDFIFCKTHSRPNFHVLTRDAPFAPWRSFFHSVYCQRWSFCVHSCHSILPVNLRHFLCSGFTSGVQMTKVIGLPPWNEKSVLSWGQESVKAIASPHWCRVAIAQCVNFNASWTKANCATESFKTEPQFMTTTGFGVSKHC